MCQVNDTSSLFRTVATWSKAGIGTSIVLETRPLNQSLSPQSENNEKRNKGTRVVFDIGATPCFDEAISSSIVIISHGHIDHVGAIFNHARAHVLIMGGNPATYYVPSALIPSLENARTAMSNLDGICGTDEESTQLKRNLIKMNFVGMQDGTEVELKQKKKKDGIQLFLRAFAVNHCGHPSLGYVIISRKKGGLKDEYKGLPSSSLKELVKNGVCLKSDDIERVEVAYTGDTCASGLIIPSCQDHNDSNNYQKSFEFLKQAFTAPLIFCEMTFIKNDQIELAHTRGHMHVNDISSVLSSHGWPTIFDPNNEKEERKLVFLHFSGRYSAKDILDSLCATLPLSILSISHTAIASFVSDIDVMVNLMKPDGCISLTEYKNIFSKEENLSS